MGIILSVVFRGKRDDPEGDLKRLQKRLNTLNARLAKCESSGNWMMSVYIVIPVAILGIILHYKINIHFKTMLFWLCFFFLMVYLLSRRISNWWLNRTRSERDAARRQMQEAVTNVLEKLPYREARRLITSYAPDFMHTIRWFNDEINATTRQQVPVPQRVAAQTPLKTALVSSTGALRAQVPTPDVAALITPAGPSGIITNIMGMLTGANSEYALICQHCHYHNGLSPAEEFPYVAFVCCNCKKENPARAIRPEGPKIDTQICPAVLPDNATPEVEESHTSNSASEIEQISQPET